MKETIYFKSGEKKSEGESLRIMECTSRGSGESIKVDEHSDCVECVGLVNRKSGICQYYYKSGNLKMTGIYLVLDYIGVPSVKDGLWNIFYESGRLMCQILYKKGEVMEFHIFDEEEDKME